MNTKRKFLLIIFIFIFAFIFLRIMNTLYYNELSKAGISEEIEYTVEIDKDGYNIPEEGEIISITPLEDSE